MAAATQQRQTTTPTAINPHDGRDELNLSEFPICYPAERVPSNIDQLTFEKEEWDSQLKQTVNRRRVITAPPSYGLPAIYDSKVLLGILALGHAKNDFSSPEVCFSRYELAQLLGLSDDGRTYRRLERSLKRWGHVTITNENSWRDNNKQRYRDEVFSIFESVEIEGRSGGGKQLDLPLSKVRFSTAFFKSLSGSNIKHLDLAFYCSLKHHTAAQAYRVLGKYLWRDNGCMEMDLKQFGVQHIGLSPNYKPTDLKRKLKPGIEELEQSGVIQSATTEQRYKKGERRGEWKVCFARGDNFRNPQIAQKEKAAPADAEDQLIGLMVERGLTKAAAKRFIADATIPRQRIEIQIEHLDFKIDKGEELPNPGGFLRTAIEEDYALPKGFMTKAEREDKAARIKAKKEEKARKEREAKEAEEQRIAQEKQEADEKWQRVALYLDSITEIERETLIDAAIAAEAEFNRQYMRRYRANPEAEGINEMIYQQGLVRHILPMLAGREAA